MRRPSGEKATDLTQSLCPLSVTSSWPLAASQTLAVWSQLPVTIRWPSEENETECNLIVVSLERQQLTAGGRVPHLGRFVRTARHDARTVRREGRRLNPSGVSLERQQLPAARRLPKFWRCDPDFR